MGMYFAIIFYNPVKKEYKKEEHFTLKSFEFAWKEVTEVAVELEKELFKEDKYWCLKEIKDITNRG